MYPSLYRVSLRFVFHSRLYKCFWDYECLLIHIPYIYRLYFIAFINNEKNEKDAIKDMFFFRFVSFCRKVIWYQSRMLNFLMADQQLITKFTTPWPNTFIYIYIQHCLSVLYTAFSFLYLSEIWWYHSLLCVFVCFFFIWSFCPQT